MHLVLRACGRAVARGTAVLLRWWRLRQSLHIAFKGATGLTIELCPRTEVVGTYCDLEDRECPTIPRGAGVGCGAATKVASLGISPGECALIGVGLGHDG